MAARSGIGSTLIRVVGALAISGVVWAVRLPLLEQLAQWQSLWHLIVDPLIGLGSLIVVLLLRRRHPFPIALATAALIVVSAASIGPALLALGTMASTRRLRATVIAATANVVALQFIGLPSTAPVDDAAPWWVRLAVMSLGVGVVVATGVAVGQRRSLIAGLQLRADAAERERAAHEKAARLGERQRIAHDMHDVLTHRISLIAMNAGALELRHDATPTERSAALATIEDNARRALRELREILEVLREPGAELTENALSLQTLITEARTAGADVRWVNSVEEPVPGPLSEVLFAALREALTNARKHAPAAVVSVSMAGGPDDGVALRVGNGPAGRDDAAMPGAGMGLARLRSEVERHGGRMSASAHADGGWVTAIWLPWAL